VYLISRYFEKRFFRLRLRAKYGVAVTDLKQNAGTGLVNAVMP
jgi:hypothetical protein